MLCSIFANFVLGISLYRVSTYLCHSICKPTPRFKFKPLAKSINVIKDIGIYHNSYVMLEFFLTLRCYSFRAPIGISKTVQIWLKNSTWINMCSFFQNILKIWLGLLSGEFSVRQAQSKVVKIKNLDFSYWAWSKDFPVFRVVLVPSSGFRVEKVTYSILEARAEIQNNFVRFLV